MPSTHTDLHTHIIFSTKDRFPFLGRRGRSAVHAYIGGCVRGLGATPLEIGGVDDHVHLLCGVKPIHAIADLIREIKKASTTWMHAHGESKFRWQDGYGAFTVSRREIDSVRAYIQGQEEHHRIRTFQDEYLAFLEDYGIEFDTRYLW